MTQDTYRFAYEEANSELVEIMTQFEQLRLRKTQIELVIEAMRPLFSDAPEAALNTASFVTEATLNFEVKVPEAAPFLVQQSTDEVAEAVVEPTMETFDEPEYAEQSSDPFQRRIDNALRHGFGGRDSRVLSLGLNGLLTRA